MLLDAENFTEVNAMLEADPILLLPFKKGDTAINIAVNVARFPEKRDAAHIVAKMIVEHPRFHNDAIFRGEEDSGAPRAPDPRDAMPHGALFEAAYHGDAYLYSMFLRNPLSTVANSRDRHGRTALHVLCDNWNLLVSEACVAEVCRVVLSDGSTDVRAEDEWGRTILQCFALQGYIEAGRMLLEDARFSEQDINVTDTHGQTILHWLTGNTTGCYGACRLASNVFCRRASFCSLILQDKRFTQINASNVEGLLMRFSKPVEDDPNRPHNDDKLLNDLHNMEISALLTAAGRGHGDVCEELLQNKWYTALNSKSRFAACCLMTHDLRRETPGILVVKLPLILPCVKHGPRFSRILIVAAKVAKATLREPRNLRGITIQCQRVLAQMFVKM